METFKNKQNNDDDDNDEWVWVHEIFLSVTKEKFFSTRNMWVNQCWIIKTSDHSSKLPLKRRNDCFQYLFSPWPIGKHSPNWWWKPQIIYIKREKWYILWITTAASAKLIRNNHFYTYIWMIGPFILFFFLFSLMSSNCTKHHFFGVFVFLFVSSDETFFISCTCFSCKFLCVCVLYWSKSTL